MCHEPPVYVPCTVPNCIPTAFLLRAEDSVAGLKVSAGTLKYSHILMIINV